MKMKLVIALAKKMASRLTGETSNPSRPPCSCSLTNERFMANVAAKANATQRIPGASSTARWGVEFRAKLNTTTTKSPKTMTDRTKSLERSSKTMSFHTITSTGRRNWVTVRPRLNPLRL